MTAADLTILLPFIVLGITALTVMLVTAFFRCHSFTALLTLVGLALSLAALVFVYPMSPRQVTPLLLLDHHAFFYAGLILAGGLSAAVLSFGYLEKLAGHREEFYVLMLLAVLGAVVIVASCHLASLFLGLEILSVALYGLVSYLRSSERSIEAGIKYLVLASVSAAFLVFGMAMVYAQLGTMTFADIASKATGMTGHSSLLLAGTAMIIVGVGFKLAVVPFHLWTPDVYEGAPAPVAAFVATVSKGSMFAFLLRYFTQVDVHKDGPLFLVFSLISIASMLAGNLLALLQNNVKRILAYSSIAHMGYLLVAFLATKGLASSAVAYYLTAYFVTTMGAFGIITVLSEGEQEAANIEDYRGLAWRRPVLAAIFTGMLLSLAGIPLTAGFVGKFYVVTAGAGSGLWSLLIVLAASSGIGLFYYLRIVLSLYREPSEREGRPTASRFSVSGGALLAVLTAVLVWLGVYPAHLLEIISMMFGSMS